VRRIVATLLVVASPAILAAPVGASVARLPVPAAPAVTPVAPPLAALSGPAVTVAPPAAPRLAPAVPAPAAVAPAVHRALATRAVRTVRAKAHAPVAAIADAAYAERLQAELCRARQIFCGLDHSGRYPAG